MTTSQSPWELERPHQNSNMGKWYNCSGDMALPYSVHGEIQVRPGSVGLKLANLNTLKDSEHRDCPWFPWVDKGL